MVLIIVALVDKAPPAVLLPAGGGLFGAIAPTFWTGRSAHSAITATAQRWVSPLLGHTLRAPKAFYAASRRHSPLDLRGHQSRPPVGIRLSTSVVTNLISLSLLLDAGTRLSRRSIVFCALAGSVSMICKGAPSSLQHRSLCTKRNPTSGRSRCRAWRVGPRHSRLPRSPKLRWR
jgi:hypothetical protein